jgi:hypothetical protein
MPAARQRRHGNVRWSLRPALAYPSAAQWDYTRQASCEPHTRVETRNCWLAVMLLAAMEAVKRSLQCVRQAVKIASW